MDLSTTPTPAPGLQSVDPFLSAHATASVPTVLPSTPAPVAKPVTVLSTANAANNIQNMQVQQTTDEQNAAAKLAASTAAKANPPVNTSAGNTTSANIDPTKAYSADEAQSLGIDLTKATYNPDSKMYTLPDTGTYSDQLSPERIAADKNASDLQDINNVFQQQSDYNDATSNAVYSSIANSFGQLMQQQVDANNRSYGALNTLGLRSGSARYAGGINTGILTSEQSAGIASLADIAAKEASAMSAAKQAQAGQNWTIFAAKRAEIDKLNTARQDELTKLQTSIQAAKETQLKSQVQSMKDNAVATLYTQGITDPAEMLTKLNETPGTNYTSADVATAMKNIATGLGTNTAGLTGNIKDFYTLQQNGSLPSSISSLPESQQLASFLQYIKPVTTKTAGVPSGTKFTVASAKAANLPLSVVGQTQTDITNSFYSEQAPQWFAEKANTEAKSVVDPTTLSGLWESYRQAYLTQQETGSGSSSGSDSGSGA